MLKFYEFFAGGGMARLGLGDDWECLFANDICEKKAQTYKANFSASEFVLGDISSIAPETVPDGGLLAWASFPCQDLSLAGNRAGLKGERSGTFWGFWDLIRKKNSTASRVPLIVLENVVGAVSSHNGKDFEQLISTLVADGYLVGAMVIDAADFIPQSRQRLFIVGFDKSRTIPKTLYASSPNSDLHPSVIIRAYNSLDPGLKEAWRWWKLSEPKLRTYRTLDDVIEWDKLANCNWDDPKKTKDILAMMSDKHREQIMNLFNSSEDFKVGTIYRRMRLDDKGKKVQRAEVRLDGVSGCLRTPGGGSSRQTLIFVKKGEIKTRLLSAREAARLMGLPDSYHVPNKYNDAYHLIGDGLAVPVVTWLSKGLLTPLAKVIKDDLKSPLSPTSKD